MTSRPVLTKEFDHGVISTLRRAEDGLYPRSLARVRDRMGKPLVKRVSNFVKKPDDPVISLLSADISNITG